MSLNETELATIRRSGEHFKMLLKEIFESFPRSARTIAGLARWTNINKSTCQRLVQSVTKTNDGIDVIMTLPGISGLEQFQSAIAQLIKNHSSDEKINQLVDEYQDLILQYANSQSELKRLLTKFQSKNASSLDSYKLKLNKRAYETNKEISGESVDTYLGVHFFRITPNDKNYIDEFILSHRQGVELTQSARPFVQAFGANFNPVEIKHPQRYNSDDIEKSNSAKSGEFLFSDFSTPGIEQTYRGFGNFANSLIYNQNLSPINNKPFDITLGHLDLKTQPNPLLHDHKTIVQGLMQRSPAKRLILMAFLEKELDRGSSVQAGCYPASVKAHEVGHSQEEYWSERFSDSPEIKIFKPDDKSLNTKLKLDHVDALIEQGFSFLKEDYSNYVGYFIDLAYPLWLTSHRLYFKFS